MPASSRSSVDLPAPLCPTRPTRSTSLSDNVMSRSTSMIGTFCSVPILPPTLPRTSFFRERDFASKIGKSTEAFQTSMLTMSSLSPRSDPVGDSGTVVTHGQEGQRPPHNGKPADDGPVVPALGVADQGRAQDLDEVVQRVQLGDEDAPVAVTIAADLAGREDIGGPHDRRHEEH